MTKVTDGRQILDVIVNNTNGTPINSFGGSGGGGSSLVSVAGTDAGGTSWIAVLDLGASPVTVTYYNPNTGATGTPSGAFVPNQETSVDVSVTTMVHSQVFEVVNGFGNTVPVVAGDVVIKKTNTMTGAVVDWYLADGVTVIDGSPASTNDVDDLIGAPVLSAYTETRIVNGASQSRTDTYDQTANALRSLASPIGVGAWA